MKDRGSPIFRCLIVAAWLFFAFTLGAECVKIHILRDVRQHGHGDWDENGIWQWKEDK